MFFRHPVILLQTMINLLPVDLREGFKYLQKECEILIGYLLDFSNRRPLVLDFLDCLAVSPSSRLTRWPQIKLDLSRLLDTITLNLLSTGDRYLSIVRDW